MGPPIEAAHWLLFIKGRSFSGPPAGELAAGILTVGPLEIAELDNDPDRPEHGRLTFTIGGGR